MNDDQARTEGAPEIEAGDAAVLDVLMAQERRALDPYFRESDPSAYVALFADEATYFDPWSAARLGGDAIRQHFMAFAGQIPPFRYEILNPAVDEFGEVAVFTFNVETYDPADDTVANRWNTTEVHRRASGGWEMVHAHWSLMESGS